MSIENIVMDLNAVKKFFTNFIKNKKHISKIFLLGSRVKGTHKFSSDLDIAFDVDALPGDSCNLATFISEVGYWREELKEYFSYPLHFSGDPLISDSLKKNSILIYERAP